MVSEEDVLSTQKERKGLQRNANVQQTFSKRSANVQQTFSTTFSKRSAQRKGLSTTQGVRGSGQRGLDVGALCYVSQL
jgi:hypothetical protein